MNNRLIARLLAKLDALEDAHRRGDDRAFDEITHQLREMIGAAWLHNG